MVCVHLFSSRQHKKDSRSLMNVAGSHGFRASSFIIKIWFALSIRMSRVRCAAARVRTHATTSYHSALYRFARCGCVWLSLLRAFICCASRIGFENLFGSRMCVVRAPHIIAMWFARSTATPSHHEQHVAGYSMDGYVSALNRNNALCLDCRFLCSK